MQTKRLLILALICTLAGCTPDQVSQANAILAASKGGASNSAASPTPTMPAVPDAGQPITPKVWKQWAKPTSLSADNFLTYDVSYRFGGLPWEFGTVVYNVAKGLDRSRSSGESSIQLNELPSLISSNITSDEAPTQLGYYKSDGAEDIKTKAGEFKDCLRLSRQGKDSGTESIEWYKSGIGLVKAKYATTYKTYAIVQTAELTYYGTQAPTPSAGTPGSPLAPAQPTATPTPSVSGGIPPGVLFRGTYATIRGTVTDSAGMPMTGVTVSASVLGAGSFSGGGTTSSTVSVTGQYSIDGAPVGDTILIKCTKSGQTWTSSSSQNTIVPLISIISDNSSMNRVNFVLMPG